MRRKSRDLLGFAYFHPVNVIAPGWLLRRAMGVAEAGRWEREDNDAVGLESVQVRVI